MHLVIIIDAFVYQYTENTEVSTQQQVGAVHPTASEYNRTAVIWRSLSQNSQLQKTTYMR